MLRVIITLFLSFILFQYNGQTETPKTTTVEIKVWGVCDMCKERIEKALDVKGVRLAEWNIETKTCKIVYKPGIISEDQIHAILAAAGHDTEKAKATDESYNSLHHCCKYNRESLNHPSNSHK